MIGEFIEELKEKTKKKLRANKMSLQNIVFHNEKVELVAAIHENNKQIPR